MENAFLSIPNCTQSCSLLYVKANSTHLQPSLWDINVPALCQNLVCKDLDHYIKHSKLIGPNEQKIINTVDALIRHM